jgi:hypothetical protein
MDPRAFAYYLMRRPETATAVMRVIKAEADCDSTHKHLAYKEGAGSRSDQQTAAEIATLALVLADPQHPPAPQPRPRNDDWIGVELADGWELRSGVYDPSDNALTCGEWVALFDPDGREYAYWDQEEWRREPALVMGAIVNSAAGFRILDGTPDTTGNGMRVSRALTDADLMEIGIGNSVDIERRDGEQITLMPSDITLAALKTIERGGVAELTVDGLTVTLTKAT